MRLMLFSAIFSASLFGTGAPVSTSDETILGAEIATHKTEEKTLLEKKTALLKEPEIEAGTFEAALFSAVTGSGPILDKEETRLMHNPNSCGLGTHGAKVRESLLSRNVMRSATGAKRMKAPKRKVATVSARESGQICGVFNREAGCTPILTAALNKWVLTDRTPQPQMADETPVSDRQKSLRTMLCKHQ